MCGRYRRTTAEEENRSPELYYGRTGVDLRRRTCFATLERAIPARSRLPRRLPSVNDFAVLLDWLIGVQWHKGRHPEPAPKAPFNLAMCLLHS